MEGMDEQYHSKHGAISESKHIFINEGLLQIAKHKKNISVLELGMGTGLNVFLTYLTALKEQLTVDMTTIEAFPISLEEAKKLNYPERLNGNELIFEKIHSCEWDNWERIASHFSLIKFHSTIQEMTYDEVYDVIYFDAFAPEKQEEVWSLDIFKKLFDCLSKDGILVTYCVKGIIRRRLQEIGFSIHKLPGPKGGKREMLKAIKY